MKVMEEITKMKKTRKLSWISGALLTLLFTGTTFADMRPIVQGKYLNGSTKFSNGRHIAYDSQGRIHTVFTQKIGNAPGNPGMYLWSDDQGASWTTGLADLDQGAAGDPTWGNFASAIKVGTDDSIHIVWYQAYKNANNKAIFYIVSHDRGATFSKPIAITAAMSDSVYVWPALTLDKNNNPHVSFSDPNGTKGIFVAKQDAAGKWLPGVKVSDNTSPKDTAGIEYNSALGTNGTLFVFWDSSISNGKVYVNRSDDLGQSWNGVSVPLSTGGGRVLWPAMTFDQAGNTYMSVTLNSGSTFKIWILKRSPDGTWSKPSLDNLFPADKVKGYMRSTLTFNESSGEIYLFVEGSPESRKNWNIWSISAKPSNLEAWSDPRRVSNSNTGDNAFVSVPTVVKGLDFVPVIWSHGDLSDSETGHLSSELPGNSLSTVMFSAF